MRLKTLKTAKNLAQSLIVVVKILQTSQHDRHLINIDGRQNREYAKLSYKLLRNETKYVNA